MATGRTSSSDGRQLLLAATKSLMSELPGCTSISYSPNFQRHIVRSSDGTFIKSFQWLEDAVDAYPDARLAPLVVLDVDAHNDTYDETSAEIPGTSPSHAYDAPPRVLNNEENAKRIGTYLYSTLGVLFRQDTGPVFTVPFEVLQERIRFLLAPINPELVNATWRMTDTKEDEDWPLQFEQLGFGAGFTVAQVAHAVSLFPHQLLLPSGSRDMSRNDEVALFAFMYQQMPNEVLDIARKQLDPFVSGSANLDFVTFAYLHWKGSWEWPNCRVAIQALPSILSTDLEPSWEVRNTKRRLRRNLHVDSAHYLEWRLRLRPWQIHSMMRTYPALIGASRHILDRQVDALQSNLYLRSATIQRLVLRQPSIFGMDEDSLQSRIQFWRHQIGLDQEELKGIITELPALLQYSVAENLVPKLEFFLQKLKLDDGCIHRITVLRPTIWGRSLLHHYIPFAQGFCERLVISEPELGGIISKAPELLLCSWRGNLLPKLDYFQSRLNLDEDELKRMIQNTPKLLSYGIQSSLEQKIGFIETSAIEYGKAGDSRQILVNNPSLLLASNISLQKRVEKLANLTKAASTESLTMQGDVFLQTFGRPSRRSGRQALCLLPVANNASHHQSPERIFSSVAEAADVCSMSRSNMYRVIRNAMEVVLDGACYQLKYIDEDADVSPSVVRVSSDQAVDISQDQKPKSALVIKTTGRAYPPENRVRGRRRAGGMALEINLPGTQTNFSFWRDLIESVYEGRAFKVLDRNETVRILLNYPHVRPSRPRCSLYAVREAGRIAREWVVRMPDLDHEVLVQTDSCNHVAFLLDQDRLARWSVVEDIASFEEEYDGPTEHVYQANPDILYPLARTYSPLLEKSISVKVEGQRSVGVLVQGALRAARRVFEKL